MKQSRGVSKLVGCVEAHLRKPSPQVPRRSCQWDGNVRQRHRIERRKYGLVLAGRDFPVLLGELEIGKSESWLIQNPALGKVVVDGPSPKEIKFQLA